MRRAVALLLCLAVLGGCGTLLGVDDAESDDPSRLDASADADGDGGASATDGAAGNDASAGSDAGGDGGAGADADAGGSARCPGGVELFFDDFSGASSWVDVNVGGAGATASDLSFGPTPPAMKVTQLAGTGLMIKRSAAVTGAVKEVSLSFYTQLTSSNVDVVFAQINNGAGSAAGLVRLFRQGGAVKVESGTGPSDLTTQATLGVTATSRTYVTLRVRFGATLVEASAGPTASGTSHQLVPGLLDFVIGTLVEPGSQPYTGQVNTFDDVVACAVY